MELKPFDLEKAKAGAKVVTRDGREVRILCFDRKYPVQNHEILGLVERETGREDVNNWGPDGRKYLDVSCGLDLRMAPTKVTRVLLIVDDPEAGILTRLFESDAAANYYCAGNGYSENNGKVKHRSTVEWEE